jgi:hypothetical protein
LIRFDFVFTLGLIREAIKLVQEQYKSVYPKVEFALKSQEFLEIVKEGGNGLEFAQRIKI